MMFESDKIVDSIAMMRLSEKMGLGMVLEGIKIKNPPLLQRRSEMPSVDIC